MEDPLVSVKMITYNHAPYIAEAIECVLKQKTNFPFELVIGEDCSKDGTRDIVFEYQKKYPNIIRVITSEQNVGIKKNSYRTTKACRGKYVAFCEGDDYWHRPDKLQKQFDYMESHPNCGLVHSNYNAYDVSSGTLIEDYAKYRGLKMPLNLNFYEIFDQIRLSFRIQTCTVMVRGNLYSKIMESDPYLYQSNHFMMGDTQLWIELAYLSEIAYIPECLATYRLVENSVSRQRDPIKAWQFQQSHSEMMLYLCEKYQITNNIRRKRELEWYDNSLRLAFFSRNGLLASEVKRRKQSFTWEDWCRYYGAKYGFFYYTFYALAALRNSLRKKTIN